MAVLPGPLPDGRRSGGDEGLGSRLYASKGPVAVHIFWIDAVAYAILLILMSDHTCILILHQTQLFRARYESRNNADMSHFAPILFTKRDKGYNCSLRLIEEQVRRALFYADHNLVTVRVFTQLSSAAVQLLSVNHEVDK